MPTISYISPFPTFINNDNKPFIYKNLQSLDNILKQGYKFTSEGKFAEALEQF